jgi:hypothetical protein
MKKERNMADRSFSRRTPARLEDDRAKIKPSGSFNNEWSSRQEDARQTGTRSSLGR